MRQGSQTTLARNISSFIAIFQRNDVNGSEDTSEKRLVTVYLSQRGKLKTFLELVQANDRRGFRTHLEAAFGKPLKEIEADWKNYLQEIESRHDWIMRLPASQLFDTPDQYRQFAVQFGL